MTDRPRMAAGTGTSPRGFQGATPSPLGRQGRGAEAGAPPTGRPGRGTDSGPSRARDAEPEAPVGDSIRVMIADDHALFRRGLEMVLAEEPGIEIVGQACDGAEAVQDRGPDARDAVRVGTPGRG